MFAETLDLCKSVNQRLNGRIEDEPVGEETVLYHSHYQRAATTAAIGSPFCL